VAQPAQLPAVKHSLDRVGGATPVELDVGNVVRKTYAKNHAQALAVKHFQLLQLGGGEGP
jgi:hypothetical protein